MSQHTQWIPVSAEGAEQQPGFRCDGCGQVKWQAKEPGEACELCAEAVPTRETFAPPADAPVPFHSAHMGSFAAAQLNDPAPSPTIDLTEALSGPVATGPKPPQPRRSRNQEDK